MIKFSCKKCGHRLNVGDQYSGKRVNCPKCGSVGVVPDNSDKIESHCKNVVVAPTLREIPAKSNKPVKFTCSMCEGEIKFPESSRGKLIECPHCNCYAEVPSGIAPTEAEKATAPIQTRTEEEAEPAVKRKRHWLIDILLYPTSYGGLETLGAVAIGPVLLGLSSIVAGCMACVGVGLLVLMLFYMLWYFGECVRDSAVGGLRAPERLSDIFSMDWEEVGLSCGRVWVCFFIFFGPLIYYWSYTGSSKMELNSLVFVSLLTYGVFFFPMGLLAFVMFEPVSELEGQNPILHIRSIVSTFLPYCVLVALFYGLAVLFVIGIIVPLVAVTGATGESNLSFILGLLYMLVPFVWLLLVAGHLLGQFYLRYEEKLNWNV